MLCKPPRLQAAVCAHKAVPQLTACIQVKCTERAFPYVLSLLVLLGLVLCQCQCNQSTGSLVSKTTCDV